MRNGAGKPVTELGHSLLACGGRTVARLIGEWCNPGGFRGRCRRQVSDDGDFPQRYAPRRLDEAGTDGARLYIGRGFECRDTIEAAVIAGRASVQPRHTPQAACREDKSST
jgi:hypothetical protein